MLLFFFVLLLALAILWNSWKAPMPRPSGPITRPPQQQQIRTIVAAPPFNTTPPRQSAGILLPQNHPKSNKTVRFARSRIVVHDDGHKSREPTFSTT